MRTLRAPEQIYRGGFSPVASGSSQWVTAKQTVRGNMGTHGRVQNAGSGSRSCTFPGGPGTCHLQCKEAPSGEVNFPSMVRGLRDS